MRFIARERSVPARRVAVWLLHLDYICPVVSQGLAGERTSEAIANLNHDKVRERSGAHRHLRTLPNATGRDPTGPKHTRNFPHRDQRTALRTANYGLRRYTGTQMFETPDRQAPGRVQEVRHRAGSSPKKTSTRRLREVRMAMLEADVNFKVVREFTTRVKEKALGAQVLRSLTPAQQVIDIVHGELVETPWRARRRSWRRQSRPPTVIMLVGLQGSGKTTSIAKLANLLKKQGNRPLVVACDVYRPAAVDQLVTLAKAARCARTTKKAPASEAAPSSPRTASRRRSG